jgi:hypothetical protein
MGAELFTQIAINNLIFNVLPDLERREKERKMKENKK